LVISRATLPEKHYDPEDGDGAFGLLVRLGESTAENIETKVRFLRRLRNVRVAISMKYARRARAAVCW